MAGFDDLTIDWSGQSYIVPAHKMMRLVAKIEDILIAGDEGQSNAISVLLGRRHMARVCEAYEAALVYAGAIIAPGEIYLSMMSGIAKGDAAIIAASSETVLAILSILAPPIHAEMMSNMGRNPSDIEKK